MSIAFYAPMKAPDHPVPSGDRRMAQALMALLEQAGRGPVELVSRFRSFERSGDPARQAKLERVGTKLAARLLRRFARRPAAARPKLWFTYHLYHKAPDHLGPVVAQALGIPYVVAEASHAPKRAGGAWDLGFQAAERGIKAADRILCLNPADRPCLGPVVGDPAACLVDLPPFLDLTPFSGLDSLAIRNAMIASHQLPADRPWLLAVGMMRPGDKLASYRALAEALHRLRARPDAPEFALVVVGDGEARPEVEAALTPFAPHWLGTLGPMRLAPLYAACDLMVWPAVNEAYGMALLEAQACGLPVLAGRVGGVPGVVADGETGILTPAGDAEAFTDALASLLKDPLQRKRLGLAARKRVFAQHSPDKALSILERQVLTPLLGAPDVAS
ncbi:MAG: glycosyltransferase family 4 protein [Rhodospirillaceae bacterium]